MVVDRNELLRRLALPAHRSQALVITPLLHPDKQLEADAVDVRLGTDFLITRSDRLTANVPGYAQSSAFQRAVHVPLGKYIVLPGHHTVLAATLEFIKFPYDLSGMVLTKSSWARTFITIETAPWIHPLYRGCLTLEIANVSETPLTMYPGITVAQIVFLGIKSQGVVGNQLATKRKQAVPELSGAYVGPTKPEAPIFKRPDEALRAELGLLHTDLPEFAPRRT